MALSSRLRDRGSLGKVFFEQPQASENNHQKIVEVVGNTSGQLADGFELPSLKELGQCRLALPSPFLDVVLETSLSILSSVAAVSSAAVRSGDPCFKLYVQRFELARLAVELGEDPNLGLEQLWHYRHRHVVHCAGLISA